MAEFYRLVGNLPQFTEAFNRFATPDQLHSAGGLLMFLEENQGVCDWGVDSQGRVFQCWHDGDDRHDMELDLSAFLELIVQYQVAQGGDYGYSIGVSDEELAELLAQDGWQETVKHNGLLIHRLHAFLIWRFCNAEGAVEDDLVYFCSLVEPPDAIKQRYDLEEL
ncbi:MAG: hypothetical protein LBV44_10075 [Methylobacillus sp.]|nr:hypothetical protein [Methylobacillus sp.]